MTEKTEPVAGEPRDYTKFIWLGVAALVGVMILIMVFGSGGTKSDQTTVKAKHILITYDAGDPVDRSEALRTVTGLRKRILDGEDFGKLAREFSGDPQSAERGGHLPPASRGAYVQGFEEYVWTAPIGQVSDVISSSFGFHLVVVLERHISSAELYEQELERRAKELLKNSSTPAEDPSPE